MSFRGTKESALTFGSTEFELMGGNYEPYYLGIESRRLLYCGCDEDVKHGNKVTVHLIFPEAPKPLANDRLGYDTGGLLGRLLPSFREGDLLGNKRLQQEEKSYNTS